MQHQQYAGQQQPNLARPRVTPTHINPIDGTPSMVSRNLEGADRRRRSFMLQENSTSKSKWNGQDFDQEDLETESTVQIQSTKPTVGKT